jgi:hypothetical protein
LVRCILFEIHFVRSNDKQIELISGEVDDMTYSREERKDGSPDSQTIRIEMPKDIFDQMCGMMARSRQFAACCSSCGGMSTEKCRPQSEDCGNMEFTFVMKRKG